MTSLLQNDLTLAEFATLFRDIRSACTVGGVAEVSEAADTIQFILKLDPSSYGLMHQDMAKKAARNDPDSYPNTIDKAVAIAQSWHVIDFLQPHQALKTVAKKDESSPRYRNRNKANGGGVQPKEKIKSDYEIKRERIAIWKTTDIGKATIAQYICKNCGKKGHIARECRAPVAQVMHVTAEEYESFMAEDDQQGNEFSDDDDDFGYTHHAFATTATRINTDDMPELVSASSSDSEEEYSRSRYHRAKLDRQKKKKRQQLASRLAAELVALESSRIWSLWRIFLNA
jgi:hypothetical protein